MALRKAELMRSIEARFGKPLEVLLPEMLESYRTQREVAKAFGVHESTINYWLLRLGLRKETQMVRVAAEQEGTGT